MYLILTSHSKRNWIDIVHWGEGNGFPNVPDIAPLSEAISEQDGQLNSLALFMAIHDSCARRNNYDTEIILEHEFDNFDLEPDRTESQIHEDFDNAANEPIVQKVQECEREGLIPSGKQPRTLCLTYRQTIKRGKFYLTLVMFCITSDITSDIACRVISSENECQIKLPPILNLSICDAPGIMLLGFTHFVFSATPS